MSRCGCGGFSHQRFELVELYTWRILASESCRTLKQIDDREKRAVLVMGRAEIVQIGVWLRIE